jgi:hypothetical protein
MGKLTSDTTKKRGRPVTTGKGTQVGTRWQDDHLKQIDDWRRKQEDKPKRSEAIRRLVEIGLGGQSKLPQKTEKHSPDQKTGKRAKVELAEGQK